MHLCTILLKNNKYENISVVLLITIYLKKTKPAKINYEIQQV